MLFITDDKFIICQLFVFFYLHTQITSSSLDNEQIHCIQLCMSRRLNFYINFAATIVFFLNRFLL